MTSLIEQYAAKIGWKIGKNTLVVEGITDCVYLQRASRLFEEQYGRPILDGDFAVVAAGEADDGGVDGINRRLNVFRQLSETYRDESGGLTHRFVGLFDNDAAGRRAFDAACKFDRRIWPHRDIFLLHPVMPLAPTNGASIAGAIKLSNRKFGQLDWEIEDLCSERIITQFDGFSPGSILSTQTVCGKSHREFSRGTKPVLRRYFLEHSVYSDALELVSLVKAFRSYLDIEYEFIQV